MNKPAAVPVPKTLAEQKVDFTAEGSPPPGNVATSAPIGPAPAGQARSPAAPARKKIKLKPASTSKKP